MASTSNATAVDVSKAKMIVLLVGSVVNELALNEVRACACECACDESCYSCHDYCYDDNECAC